MKIGTYVWQFGTDYPGAQGDDSKLPLSEIWIKAWDGTSYMSRYDKHAQAVSGPAQITKLARIYRAQGITARFWAVPKGRSVAAMLALAKATIDASAAGGGDGLYLDIEPYAGFCNADCVYLAGTLGKQLSAARPSKTGIIYDPRPQHWDREGLRQWLPHVVAASPMVYWRSFAGQGVWGTPDGAVTQAHKDVRALGFRGAYIPSLQGNAPALEVAKAISVGNARGVRRYILWRRGVVTAGTWTQVAGIAEPVPPPPPVDPCAAVKAELAACRTAKAVLERDLTNKIRDRDRIIGQLREQITGLNATIKLYGDQITELRPDALAWRRLRELAQKLIGGHA